MVHRRGSNRILGRDAVGENQKAHPTSFKIPLEFNARERGKYHLTFIPEYVIGELESRGGRAQSSRARSGRRKSLRGHWRILWTIY